MQGVESIVISQRNVSAVVQKQRQHIIALLRYGIMQRSVTFQILELTRNRIKRQSWHGLNTANYVRCKASSFSRPLSVPV